MGSKHGFNQNLISVSVCVCACMYVWEEISFMISVHATACVGGWVGGGGA